MNYIWYTKFKILERKVEKSGKKLINYTLNDDLSQLEIYKVYITSFFKILWSYPESVFYILKNLDISDIKENLSNFIVNIFFPNKLSSDYMGNNLLYVITMLLKYEIEQLNSKSDISSFLEKSKSAILLDKMIKMPDIQMYFRKIFFQMIEKIENCCSSKKIIFNMDIIIKELKNYIELEKKRLGKKNKKTNEELILKYINSKILEKSMNIQEMDSEDENTNDIKKIIYFEGRFNKCEKSIEKDELEKLKEEAEKNKKKILSEYYSQLIENIKQKKNEGLYHVNLLNNYNDKDIDKKYLLFIYQRDFLNVISFLETFIDDLLKNISLIPNSIKNICKIMVTLFRKKFPDLTKIEENIILSKFFVEKLLIPTLRDASSISFMNEFFISENTLYNILTVSIIIKKLLSWKLFQNGARLANNEEEKFFTYFNRFILEENEKIIYFFQKITNCNLPSFIHKYINNLLPADYLYDYFKENPEEIYASISICFSMDNLSSIVKGVVKSKNELFNLKNDKTNKLKKIFTKFDSAEKMNELMNLDNQMVEKNFCDKIKLSNSLKKIDKSLIEDFEFVSGKNERTKSVYIGKKVKNNHYIINVNEIESQYKHLFEITNKIEGFYIDVRILEKKRKLEEKEKNIIKLKNYLTNSLNNHTVLTRSSFKPNENVISIFRQMHKQMTSSNDILDNNQSIPSNWSMRSILDLMEIIPEDYKKNEYEKFFVELNNNIDESISEFNFEKLFVFKKKVNNLKKIQNYYKNYMKLLDDKNNNEIIKDFIEKSFCPVEVKFSYDEEEKIFELKKSNVNKKLLKDSDIIENPKDDSMIFKTILSFVKYFPDLNIYQDKMDINPFHIIEELSINSKLFDYFNIVKSYFIQEKNCTEEIYKEIYEEKLKNYIMNKIYKKIYPREIEYDDSKLFEKTMHLSWVEPKMIIPGDITLDALDKILPEILGEFKHLNKANSPFIKLKCIKKIFEYIGQMVKFNDGGEGENRELGAEDITPYLNFILIRACPVRILTDIEYVKLFMKNKGNFEYDLLNIKMMCENILKSTYKTFNISENEYIKKCNEAIANNKNNNDQRFNEIIDRFEISNI